MSSHRSTRRQFLLTSLATTGSLVASSACHALPPHGASSLATADGSPPATPKLATALPPALALPERRLGRTNLTLPILGLGGAASPLARDRDQTLARTMIERAYALGIRYFDTAANYGPSEVRLGEVLPPWRSSVVLASKTSDRSYDGAWRHLDRSLTNLRTDHLDLWQFHALTHDWDLDTILDPRHGAIRAAEEAKAQGVIRHIGITGHHNPDIIVTALNRYPFATALIPVNAADIHTPRSFIRQVLPTAQAKNTGIIAMKVPAYGRLLKPGVLEGMHQAIGYSLSQSGVHTCIIAAETLAQLDDNAQAAASFQPLSSIVLQQIEHQTQPVWQENSFFRNWG